MKPEKKVKRKIEFFKELFEAYHNGGISIKSLAKREDISERTLYRQFNSIKNGISEEERPKTIRTGRPPKFNDKVFARILELKNEIPQRSAIIIQKYLKKDVMGVVPSLTTIRAYLREQGFGYSNSNQKGKKGYIRFEREYPNDLWQIDIAGVRNYGHLNECYLIALLDDCSRYVVSARYYPNQQMKWVFEVIRMAIEKYGRPNQILADNGTQFRNIIHRNESKYEELLKNMGIQPIFARVRHPQTKGKLERWFGTVVRQFYPEGLAYINGHSKSNFEDLNTVFLEWLQWYNYTKPHKSLPYSCQPSVVYLEHEKRLFRPLQTPVNWGRYLSESDKRKVRKTNLIQYKREIFDIPAGYRGRYVDVYEYNGKLRIFHNEKFLIEYDLSVHSNVLNILQDEQRIISASGTIGYRGNSYYVNYKLKGKKALLKEIEGERILHIYVENLLVKTLEIIE